MAAAKNKKVTMVEMLDEWLLILNPQQGMLSYKD